MTLLACSRVFSCLLVSSLLKGRTSSQLGSSIVIFFIFLDISAIQSENVVESCFVRENFRFIFWYFQSHTYQSYQPIWWIELWKFYWMFASFKLFKYGETGPGPWSRCQNLHFVKSIRVIIFTFLEKSHTCKVGGTISPTRLLKGFTIECKVQTAKNKN